MSRCGEELCPNWAGDGNVCPCALFDLERPCVDCGHALGTNDLCGTCERETER